MAKMMDAFFKNQFRKAKYTSDRGTKRIEDFKAKYNPAPQPGSGDVSYSKPVDPRVGEITALNPKERAKALRKDFEAQIPNYVATENLRAEDDARRQIAERSADIPAVANQRGLLYGGLQRELTGDVQLEALQNLAGRKAQINDEAAGLLEQGGDLERSGIYNDLQNRFEENLADYEERLAKRKASSEAVAGLARGVGDLLGVGAGYLAKRG